MQEQAEGAPTLHLGSTSFFCPSHSCPLIFRPVPLIITHLWLWGLGQPSFSILYQSQMLLWINLVSTWMAFSFLIWNGDFRKEQEKTTDIPKPQGYMEIQKCHTLSGFETREQADKIGAWCHLQGRSSCHSRNFFGKIPPQSRDAKEHIQIQSWRKQDHAQILN